MSVILQRDGIPKSKGTQLVMDSEQASAPEYLDSLDLEKLTGTPASTWRYWAHIGSGPASFKIGRRRVWKRSTILAWLESQEAASA